MHAGSLMKFEHTIFYPVCRYLNRVREPSICSPDVVVQLCPAATQSRNWNMFVFNPIVSQIMPPAFVCNRLSSSPPAAPSTVDVCCDRCWSKFEFATATFLVSLLSEIISSSIPKSALSVILRYIKARMFPLNTYHIIILNILFLLFIDSMFCIHL